jgi:hypothetical protein
MNKAEQRQLVPQSATTTESGSKFSVRSFPEQETVQSQPQLAGF